MGSGLSSHKTGSSDLRPLRARNARVDQDALDRTGEALESAVIERTGAGKKKVRVDETVQRSLDRKLGKLARDYGDRIVEIYQQVLDLEPPPGASPGSQMDFRTRQINQLEKLLNRVQGMPVQRQRFVDRDDDDIQRPDVSALPMPVVTELLKAALIRGQDEGRELERRDSAIEVLAEETDEPRET